MPRRRQPEGRAPRKASRRAPGSRAGRRRGRTLLFVAPAFAVLTAGVLILESMRGDASVVARATREAAGRLEQGEAATFHDTIAQALASLQDGVLVTRQVRGGTVFWSVERGGGAGSDIAAKVDEKLREAALRIDAALWLYRPEGAPRRYELFAAGGASAVVQVVLDAPPKVVAATPHRGPAATEFEEAVPEGAPRAHPEAALAAPTPAAPTAVSALPLPPTGSGPVCAIIIDDLGEHPELIETAIGLGFPVSYAVIPHLPFSRECARRLHEAGQEIMLHLPMEPLSFPRHDPGRQALFRGMDPGEIESLTKAALDAVPEARGVNNHMGSSATRDARLMREVLRIVKQRSLYFIDSRTASDSVAYRIARELEVPSAARHVFLDDAAFEPEQTRRQLQYLFDLARQQGRAIGIGHWHPSTLEVLREAPAMAGSDVKLVFASAMTGAS